MPGRPFVDKPLCPSRNPSIPYFQRIDPNLGKKLGVLHMEMGRRVIIVEHTDFDAVET
jgi:hypothetical protein